MSNDLPKNVLRITVIGMGYFDFPAPPGFDFAGFIDKLRVNGGCTTPADSLACVYIPLHAISNVILVREGGSLPSGGIGGMSPLGSA